MESSSVAPAARGKRSAGKQKRAARSLSAVVSTTATRLLNQLHTEGKQKKTSVNAAVERAAALATGRGEELSEELKEAIGAKAEEIWAGGKK